MTKMHGTVVNAFGETFAYYCGRQAGAEWRDMHGTEGANGAALEGALEWESKDARLDYRAGFMAAVLA